MMRNLGPYYASNNHLKGMSINHVYENLYQEQYIELVKFLETSYCFWHLVYEGLHKSP